MNVGTIALRKIDGLTITVKITRELRMRVRLATLVIKFAAFVLGGKAEVQVDFKKP